MPLYTYHCECCDHEFDKKQKFSDENLTLCPNCNEGCLRRVYKPARVVFKGSGFYITDNKSSLRSARSGSESDSKPEKKDKSEKKEDTKKKPAEKKTKKDSDNKKS